MMPDGSSTLQGALRAACATLGNAALPTVPAHPAYFIEPIFEQFAALLPEPNMDHPLGDAGAMAAKRVIFDKLV
jgi:hypothetical protein